MELLDGILMPVAVGFLYLLAISDVLPEAVRASGLDVFKMVKSEVKGAYKWITGGVFTVAARILFSVSFFPECVAKGSRL